MSMTNAQRTKLINVINGADVRIITIDNGLLDMLDLKRFLPPAVNDLLHRHCTTFFLYRANDDSKGRDSLTRWIDGGKGKKIYAIGFADDAANRGPYYLLMLLARELARVVCDAEHMTDPEDHEAILRNFANYLVLLINEHTGKDITDDANYNPTKPPKNAATAFSGRERVEDHEDSNPKVSAIVENFRRYCR